MGTATGADGPAKDHWTSRSAFILAAIGSAVGLGNIWRFPSEAGLNGGGAFVIFYILCVALLGLPVLLSEMLIGRHGQASAVESAKKLALQSGVSAQWSWLASIGMWASFLILCFYSVVAGWVLYYALLFAGELLTNGIGQAFAGQSAEDVAAYLDALFVDGPRLVLLHLTFIALTMFVVSRGISGGIEKAATILMPAFFLLLLGITVYSLATGATREAVDFLFAFDPARLLHGSVMLSALGQAFFSLSLGAAMMITYGAYADKSTHLPTSALSVGVADTMVAIIAGLAIFPITLAAGLSVEAGPTLMFQSLPVAFRVMPGGTLVGLIFFIMVLFAALTSSVSVLEVPVSRAIERFGWSRKFATLVIGGAAFLIGVAAALSLGAGLNVRPLGFIPLFDGQGVFDTLDTLTGKVLMPLSGFLTAIFVGWRADRRIVAAEHGMTGAAAFLWRALIAWLCPLAVGLILVVGIVSG